MRKLLYLLTLLCVAVASCGGNDTDNNAAARAAKEYYDHLIKGCYVDYVNGYIYTDSLPPQYREQLVINAKQFMAQQQAEHGGIASVQVVASQTDTLTNTTNAYLMFCYGDSVHEEIVVPMVQRGEQWLMR